MKREKRKTQVHYHTIRVGNRRISTTLHQPGLRAYMRQVIRARATNTALPAWVRPRGVEMNRG